LNHKKKGIIIYVPEIALMGKRRGKYKVLLGKPERERETTWKN
jgi:hypothetical protein